MTGRSKYSLLLVVYLFIVHYYLRFITYERYSSLIRLFTLRVRLFRRSVETSGRSHNLLHRCKIKKGHEMNTMEGHRQWLAADVDGGHG